MQSRVDATRCLSCRKGYASHAAGTCKECYEESNHKILDLETKVAFLQFSSSLDPSSSPCFSDVVLVASHDATDQTDLAPPVPIHAHKAVLANRSPVFRAMLENQMEEALSGTIKISDVSHDVLRAFVNYLYTAEACLDVKMARDLLEMAEKYQVEHLKAYCEKLIISKLNPGNPLNSFLSCVLASKHKAKNLLDAALSLIVDNMDKFVELEEYEELKKDHPQLVFEIYEAYHAKQVETAALKEKK
ncbi:BTB/POZ domain [Dillenia turbinata]|uniref:BTB/POZ domain n=1 Tax=Dillenia turbinata TaxID=194707 RepID=A0AAN8W693_9MAGN